MAVFLPLLISSSTALGMPGRLETASSTALRMSGRLETGLASEPLRSPTRRLACQLAASLATPLAWAAQPSPAVGAADAFSELSSRLDAPLVMQPSSLTMAGREAQALPPWIAGRWQATQTLERYSTPQGIQYIGAAGRPISEAEASAAQTRAQIGKAVSLELRWKMSASGGAVEDRSYNVRSRLDAFAGRAVVRSAKSCADAGVDAPGTACTFVEFKGPIQQKTIVTSVRAATPAAADGASAPAAFVSSDVQRTILARILAAGDTRNFPPLTADSEVLLSLAPVGPDSATGRLRLIEYLNPQDPLYFAAGGKSVSISDYSLALSRLPAAEGGE